MEFMLLCGVILAMLVVLSFQYLSSIFLTKSSSNPLLPPGKTGWPVIGESLEFLYNMRNCQLERFSFKRMAKFSPVLFRTSILGDPFAVFCGPAGSKFLFSNANKLVTTTMIRPAKKIFGNEKLTFAFHQHMRPALVAFVKADGLKSFVGVMDTMAQSNLESRWPYGQVTTVYSSVKWYAFSLACRLFMSIEDPDVVESLFDPIEISMSGIQALPINLPGTRLRRSLNARAALRSRIQQIIRQRRLEMESSNYTDHKTNLLSTFVKAHEDDVVVADGIVVMLVAGHDTVTSVLCLIFKVMADYPDVYRRVYQENVEVEAKKRPGEALSWEDTTNLRYTWNVAREVMRLYPTTSFLTREAMTDFTYAGFHVPKGHKLLTNIYATHKDPNYWKDPEKFEPSRFEGEGPLPFTYFPFGGGPSMCPGMNYAQLAILVFVHNAVMRIKWELVVPDEKIMGIPVPRPAQGLPVLVRPLY